MKRNRYSSLAFAAVMALGLLAAGLAVARTRYTCPGNTPAPNSAVLDLRVFERLPGLRPLRPSTTTRPLVSHQRHGRGLHGLDQPARLEPSRRTASRRPSSRTAATTVLARRWSSSAGPRTVRRASGSPRGGRCTADGRFMIASAATARSPASAGGCRSTASPAAYGVHLRPGHRRSGCRSSTTPNA